jgi:putative ABC transport system permease protein
MILGDTVYLAMRNLRQAKLRTALTTLGVSIGIASLAGMVSLGVGLEDQFTSRLTKAGLFDSISVMPAPMNNPGGLFGRGNRGRGAAEPGARLGGQAPVQPPPQPVRKPLDEAAIQSLLALPHVKDVFPTLRVNVQVKFAGNTERMMAAAVPMSAKGEGNFQKFAFGTFFTNDTDKQCLITLDMAKQINANDPGSLVGQELTLGMSFPAAPGTLPAQPVVPGPAGALATMANAFRMNAVEEKYTIVGIVERDPGGPLGGALGNSGLMIPMRIAKAASRQPFAQLTVKVNGAAHTGDVEDEIKKMGYGAFSIQDALEGAKRAFLILDIVLGLIGSIALAVSSLGIVNTMVMSILERTREIGVMKAIGGSDGDIRRIFLVEASTIGFLGGVGGVTLGWLVSRAINFGANVYIRNQGGEVGNLFAFPWWLILGALGFSILVSLMAGSYPAGRAARLNPMQALRHD